LEHRKEVRDWQLQEGKIVRCSFCGTSHHSFRFPIVPRLARQSGRRSLASVLVGPLRLSARPAPRSVRASDL
jgi:hypothetical protein